MRRPFATQRSPCLHWHQPRLKCRAQRPPTPHQGNQRIYREACNRALCFFCDVSQAAVTDGMPGPHKRGEPTDNCPSKHDVDYCHCEGILTLPSVRDYCRSKVQHQRADKRGTTN